MTLDCWLLDDAITAAPVADSSGEAAVIHSDLAMVQVDVKTSIERSFRPGPAAVGARIHPQHLPTLGGPKSGLL